MGVMGVSAPNHTAKTSIVTAGQAHQQLISAHLQVRQGEVGVRSVGKLGWAGEDDGSDSSLHRVADHLPKTEEDGEM